MDIRIPELDGIETTRRVPAAGRVQAVVLAYESGIAVPGRA